VSTFFRRERKGGVKSILEEVKDRTEISKKKKSRGHRLLILKIAGNQAKNHT